MDHPLEHPSTPGVESQAQWRAFSDIIRLADTNLEGYNEPRITMDSPFHRHLSTNYVPSNSEIDSINTYIEGRNEYARSLDAQLAEIQKVMASIRAVKAENRIYIEQHQALLSPMRTMPEDILFSIFLATLPNLLEERPEKGQPVILDRRAYASQPILPPSTVVLSQVCRDWRCLVIGSPFLWSTIHITLLPNPRQRKVAVQMVEAVKTWLRRSNQCALDLWVTANFTPEDTSFDPALEEVVKLLHTSCRRWKRVRFDFAISNRSLLRLFDPTPQELPLLQSIFVDVRLWYDDPDDEPIFLQAPKKLSIMQSGLFAAPLLRSLTFRGPDGDFRYVSTPNITKRWESLAELHIDIYPTSEFGVPQTCGTREVLHLLKAAPNLTQCSIFQQSIGVENFTPSPTLLQKLKTLNLMGYPPCKGFAASLALPSLEVLSIGWDERKIKHPINSSVKLSAVGHNSGFVEIITQFGKQLTTLTLFHELLPRSTLTHCLEQLHNVVHLRLVGARGARSHLDEISRQRDKFILEQFSQSDVAYEDDTEEALYLPKLQTLDIAISDFLWVELAFLDFIFARQCMSEMGAAAQLFLIRVEATSESEYLRPDMDGVRERLLKRGVILEDLKLDCISVSG
ncbi:hypothetical protein D9611_001666 [Ephemerocybe angulata]|uniref:F-box domain-containing protein n=1 Tax=Ephemerocybe angulata TaxID=980116 RepID=A0A8H5CKA8_9AGAR|nr:hypothetical protein D9611_001666 [Tulosesus angulatus]